MSNKQETTYEVLERSWRAAIDNLNAADPTSDGYAKLLDTAKTLHEQLMIEAKQTSDDFNQIRKLELEENRAKLEAEQKAKELALAELKATDDKLLKTRELDLEEARQKSQRRQNIVTGIITGVSAATGVASLGAGCYWMAKGLRFEETGAYTSKTANNVKTTFGLFKTPKV